MYMEGRSKNPELVYVEWPSEASGINPTLQGQGPSLMMQLWKAVEPHPEVAARQLPIHLDTHLALSEIEMGRLKTSVEWLKQLRQKYKDQVRLAAAPHHSERASALHIWTCPPPMPAVAPMHARCSCLRPCTHLVHMCRSHL